MSNNLKVSVDRPKPYGITFPSGHVERLSEEEVQALLEQLQEAVRPVTTHEMKVGIPRSEMRIPEKVRQTLQEQRDATLPERQLTPEQRDFSETARRFDTKQEEGYDLPTTGKRGNGGVGGKPKTKAQWIVVAVMAAAFGSVGLLQVLHMMGRI